MPSLEDSDAPEGDATSAPADAPGAIPADDAAPAVTESIGKDVIDSASVQDAPVQHFRRNTSRLSEARKAFAAKIAESKAALAATTEPAKAAATDAEVAPDPEDDDAPLPESVVQATKAAAADVAAVLAKAAAAPPAPSLDPEVQKIKAQLAAERDELAKEREKDTAARSEWEKARLPIEASLEDYLDKPVTSYRGWLEAMHGSKLSDEDFKAEMHDFVTQASADVLGVPLPENIRTRLEAQQARKIVRTHKTVQAKKEALAAKQAEEARTAASTKAEEERMEQEWTKANDAIGGLFAAEHPSKSAATYPWLAAEDTPGKIVVDVIRAAVKKDGTQLSWQEAAKKANDYLESQWKAYYDKRKPLLGAPATAAPASKPLVKNGVNPKPIPAPAAPAPAPKQPATVEEYIVQGRKNRDKHMDNTRAAFRQALATKPASGE